MVNSNANAIGIIFPNSYDNLVPELAGDRLMASIPFAGRYRIIRLPALQSRKLRDQQYCHRGTGELSFPDGPSGLRTSVGSSQKNGGPQYFSALCGEKYEGLQRTRRGT